MAISRSILSHAVSASAGAALVTLVLVVGCGDPNGRQQVTGSVTLDGQPLPDGEVSLRPFDTGPSAAGQIIDGKFVLNSDKGPPPGKYIVKIESMKQTGNRVKLPGTNLQVDEIKQIVPEQYNEESQLVIEVTGGGQNHFDLELKQTELEE